MKNFLKKFLKIVIICAIAISVCFVFNDNKSNADAGHHTSHSSSSHSSSRSRSSSSSKSRSSSKSSSSKSSSKSYSSSSSSSIGSLVTTFLILIIIMIIISNSKKGNVTSSSMKVVTKKETLDKIKQLIPNFNEKEFLKNGYNIFIDIENAWMNFELDKVRNVITDEMFNMYDSQLASMEIKGEQNIMKDFVLKGSAIKDVVKQNDNIEIVATYIIEFYDYIVNKESGKLIRGNKNRKVRMMYDFTFIMSDTDEKIDKCPNCGAPIDVNSAGICEYCDSKIIGENINWVMSKKVCIRQINL